MAQFIAGAKGNRQSVTRLGSKNSGVTAWAHGWRLGAECYTSHYAGTDAVTIGLDGGSNHSRDRLPIIIVQEHDTLATIARKLRDTADYIEKHADLYAGWSK
jgi:hypothetical protein